MPVKGPLSFDYHDVILIVSGDDFGRPVLRKQSQFMCQVDCCVRPFRRIYHLVVLQSQTALSHFCPVHRDDLAAGDTRYRSNISFSLQHADYTNGETNN